MNLADELIQKVIDGDLSRNDQRELDALIQDDPAIARQLENTLEVEHRLRNLDEQFDVSDAVMHRIRQSAMIRPAPRGAAGSRVDSFVDRWVPKLAVSLTAAAAIIIAFVAIIGDPVEPAEVASFEGMVTVTRSGQGQSAGDFERLRPGDQIAVSKGSRFKLRYDDGTEVKIGSGTEVVFEFRESFEIAESPSKQLELISGRIEADVSPQPDGHPLVFKTDHAFAVVRGTYFTLQADEFQTRLDVTEGRVDLVKISDGAVVSVGAGEFALADSGTTIDAVPGGPRASEGLVAFYTFEEGSDETVHDRSGVDEPLDLRIESSGRRTGTWLLNGGYELTNGAALFSQSTADRIVEECRKSGALTLEAWVEPTRIEQDGPARIVTFSKGTGNVNFMLGQSDRSGGTGESFVSRIRTSKVNPSNPPSLEFQEQIDGSLVHLVVTRDPAGNLLLYRNGVLTSKKQLKGDFTNWQEGLRLGLGNDPDDHRPWEGALYLVAIYSRALSSEEVQQNFQAGPHQRAGEM